MSFKNSIASIVSILVDDTFSAAFLDENSVLNLPTQSRWLTGEEYAFLLRHYRAYTTLFPQDILIEEKAHP